MNVARCKPSCSPSTAFPSSDKVSAYFLKRNVPQASDCARLIGRGGGDNDDDHQWPRPSSSQSNQDTNAKGPQIRSPTHSPKQPSSSLVPGTQSGASRWGQGAAAVPKRRSTPQKEKKLRPLSSHGRGRKAPRGALPHAHAHDAHASGSGAETPPMKGTLFGPGTFGGSILDDEPPLDVAVCPCWLL